MNTATKTDRALPATAEVQKHEPLRIVIVHRNPLFRLGLRSVLERHGIEIMGEALDLLQILQLAALCPDVVLFDASLTFCDAYQSYRAVEVVPLIRQAGARRIFVFACSSKEEDLFQFLMAGAFAYELPTLDGNDLVEKVRCVAQDEYLFGDEVIRPVKRQPVRLPPPLLLPPQAETEVAKPQELLGITDREIEVLLCVRYGLSNVRIGTRLGITDMTVKNHLTHILGKLNVPNRTGAVVTAIRKGLITWNDPLPDQQDTATSTRTERRQEVVV